MNRYRKKEKVGRLNIRVAIQNSIDTTNDFGEAVPNWGTYITIFAELKYLTGGSDERQVNDRKTAVTRCDFVIRYRTDLDETMRIVADGKGFDILSILRTDPKNRYMTIEGLYKQGQYDVSAVNIDDEERLIDDVGDFLISG